MTGLPEHHIVLEMLDRPQFREAMPSSTVVSFQEFDEISAKYTQKDSSTGSRYTVVHRTNEEDGKRAFRLALESFDQTHVWVAELTQYKSKAWDWVARYQIKRSADIDEAFGVASIFERRSKIIGGIQYGMKVSILLLAILIVTGCEDRETDQSNNSQSLSHTGRVEGQVMFGTQPGNNVSVWYMRYDQEKTYPSSEPAFETDDEGRFQLDLSPGKYCFYRMLRYNEISGSTRARSLSSSHATRVEVKEGEISSVIIGGSGCTVIGQLVPDETLDKDKIAFQSWDNVLNLKKTYTDGFPGNSLHIHVDEDGSFRCQDVDPGTYAMDIMVMDKTKDVDLDNVIGAASGSINVPHSRELPNGVYDLGDISLSKFRINRTQ